MFSFKRILLIILLFLPITGEAFELQILLTKVQFPAVYFSQTEVMVEDGREDLYRISNRHNIKLSLFGELLALEGKAFPLPVTLSSEENLFFINGKGYRGKLQVNKVDGKIVFINLIDLEDYLRGVVSKEMPASWPLEALKAQAVIARTYAIYKALKTDRIGFHLYDSTLDQVYYGLEGESNSGDMAVEFTKDIILLYNNEIIKSYYHSTSGGMTENPVDVWGDEYPYLESTVCGYDAASPAYTWEYSISRSELENLLKKNGFPKKTLLRIRPVSYTASDRNKKLEIIYQDHTVAQISGVDLRSIVGNVKLKSTRFQVLNRGDSFYFRGTGSGHGVGLCQWGARGMAEKGFTFQQILQKYYVRTTLSKVRFVTDSADDSETTEKSGSIWKGTRSNSDDGELDTFLDDVEEKASPRGNTRVPLEQVIH